MFLLLSLFRFLGPHLRHVEVPRPGVKSELQLPASTTATATPDPGRILDLRCSLRQCRILDPLQEAGDQTCILMDTSQVHFHLSHNRNSRSPLVTSVNCTQGHNSSPHVQTCIFSGNPCHIVLQALQTWILQNQAGSLSLVNLFLLSSLIMVKFHGSSL